MQFIRNYIKSMRLHFGFITAIAGWVGISYYEFMKQQEVFWPIKIVFLILLFLSYGVNQVVNDYFGIEEDKVNAPERPMVTGKLHPKGALLTSLGIMVLVGAASYFLSPWAPLVVFAGVALNIIYEYAKAVPLLGNFVFGLSIVTCPIFGVVIAGPVDGAMFTAPAFAVLALLVYVNGLMTYFTYFKDYEGDRLAGKKTFITIVGVEKARYWGVVFSIVPIALVVLFSILGLFDLTTLSWASILICIVTIFLQLWTAFKYYSNPIGDKTYYNLSTNIQACVMAHVAVISLFAPELAISLMISTYILIDLIFGLHGNANA